MKRIHGVLAFCVLLIIGVMTNVACSIAPNVSAANTPTSASQPLATATSEASPTAQATSTPVPASPTLAPSRTGAAVTRPATPQVPITAATIVSPAIGDASGSAANVFATALRVNPSQPVSGPDYVTFYITFNNTSGIAQQLQWYVKIWSPANSTQSFGETAKQINDIPPGVSEIAAASNWRTNSMNCEPFTARVYWLNSNVNFGNPNEFKKPNGGPGPQLNFQVCPATPAP